jgi:cysteine-rich repeat protein
MKNILFILLVALFTNSCEGLKKLDRSRDDSDKNDIDNNVPDSEDINDSDSMFFPDMFFNDNNDEAHPDEDGIEEIPEKNDDGINDNDVVDSQPMCGDGIKEGDEECDDGNSNNNDYCRNDCYFNICGDGYILDGVEECDSNVISCATLNLGTDGTALCSDFCDGFITDDNNCKKYFECPDKPSNSSWNIVSGYEQMWIGDKWSPADSSGSEYNQIPADNSCRYVCNEGYEFKNGICEKISNPCIDNETCAESNSSFEECIPEETSAGSGLYTGYFSCKCGENDVWNGQKCSVIWTDIASSSNQSCAIYWGRMNCWGNVSSHNGIEFRPVMVGEKEDWEKVFAGYSNICGIASGELYCWGFNTAGQIGNGSSTLIYKEPVKVGSRSDWQMVDISYTNVCGIANGELFCWGGNEHGEVGDGTTELRNSPVKISLENSWEYVSTGSNISCGILNGDPYCWGETKSINGSTNYLTPTKVKTAYKFDSISVGNRMVCGISGGKLLCWGVNTMGQIGDGTTDSKHEPVEIGSYSDWEAVESSYTTHNLGVASSTCAIRSKKLYCWGENKHGKLGIGDSENRIVPSQVKDLSNWSKVSIGYNHTCGINGGAALCWGNNESSKLGTLYSSSRATPELVDSDTIFDDVVAGEQSSFGLSNGSVYFWGYDMFYPENIYENHDFQKPLLNESLASWEKIKSYAWMVCGLLNGSIHCLGQKSPNIEAVEADMSFDLFDVGGNFSERSLFAISNGELYCQGANSSGQLGDGTSAYRSEFVKIGDLSSWENVSTSKNSISQHTCGIAEGKLYCWGENEFGQLGDVTTVDKNYPVRIGSLENWEKVSAGYFHTCGIAGGELFCWGRGSIGDGSNESRIFPVKISERTDWTIISADNYNACGIASGELYCWGRLYYNSEYNSYTFPTRINSNTDWANVSCGSNHVCAISETGKISCWGNNGSGQLGDNKAWYITPQPVF